MSKMYLISGSDRVVLAKGTLEVPASGDTIRLKIGDGKAETVAEHQIVIIMGEEAGEMPIQCHLVERSGDVIALRKMMQLDSEYRRSLRIPVRFDSFIYPVDDSFKGRKLLRSIDLSHGGIAFYSDEGMKIGDILEVVIPVTTQPLIVKMKILRRQELANGRTYYAAEFVDLLEDEETMICKAVFGIQLEIGREKEMLAT